MWGKLRSDCHPNRCNPSNLLCKLQPLPPEQSPALSLIPSPKVKQDRRPKHDRGKEPLLAVGQSGHHIGDDLVQNCRGGQEQAAVARSLEAGKDISGARWTWAVHDSKEWREDGDGAAALTYPPRKDGCSWKWCGAGSVPMSGVGGTKAGCEATGMSHPSPWVSWRRTPRARAVGSARRHQQRGALGTWLAPDGTWERDHQGVPDLLECQTPLESPVH